VGLVVRIFWESPYLSLTSVVLPEYGSLIERELEFWPVEFWPVEFWPVGFWPVGLLIWLFHTVVLEDLTLPLLNFVVLVPTV
jgi:hypothetical protein